MFRVRTFPIVEKCSIAKDTIEERILDLQDKKAELPALLD